MKRQGRTITCSKCKRNTMRLTDARPFDADSSETGAVIFRRLWTCIAEVCGNRETTSEVRQGVTEKRTLPDLARVRRAG